jgi:hypothetical protein
MSKEQLREFAATSEKNLPKKAAKNKSNEGVFGGGKSKRMGD